MDFSFSEDQHSLIDLCRKLFGELCTADSITHLERESAAGGEDGPPVFHTALWKQLAHSELLGLSLSQPAGGAGLGVVESCLLLEQAGWVAAPLPLIATVCMAGAAIDQFGSAAQRQALLSGVIAGTRVLCAATEHVAAERGGSGYSLSGVADCVAWAPSASHAVVTARDSMGEHSALIVDLSQPGVRIERQTASNGESLGRVCFEGCSLPESALLGAAGGGAQILSFLRERGRLAQCAYTLGMCARALRLTAEYSVERKQFGRSIGSFQAVGQRAADAFIDVETIRVALWRAAWLIDDGQPAADEVLVASYWAKEAGHRVVNAAQHIHAGIGFDRDYPLFRYFLGVKTLEQRLGSATSCLSELGGHIARD